MVKTRDSSYTLCKGLVKNILEKNDHVTFIKIDILEINDLTIKTNININDNIRSFDIILNKKKKEMQSL